MGITTCKELYYSWLNILRISIVWKLKVAFSWLQVIDVQLAQLWFSGKEMLPGKKLKDYLGPNEKTKIIVKLQKRGGGKPAREPLMSEEERKRLMLHAYNRQEQLKVSRNFRLPIK